MIHSKLLSTRFNGPSITPDMIKRLMKKKCRVYNKAKDRNDKHRAAFKKYRMRPETPSTKHIGTMSTKCSSRVLKNVTRRSSTRTLSHKAKKVRALPL